MSVFQQERLGITGKWTVSKQQGKKANYTAEENEVNAKHSLCTINTFI